MNLVWFVDPTLDKGSRGITTLHGSRRIAYIKCGTSNNARQEFRSAYIVVSTLALECGQKWDGGCLRRQALAERFQK